MRLLLFFCLLAGGLVGCQSETSSDLPDATLTANNAVSPSIDQTPSDGKNLSRIFQLADLKTVNVTTKNKELKLWLMDTEDKRREGMMFVDSKEVADDQGMIFAFKEPQLAEGGRGFWMKNTPTALDIVYVDAKKKVINIGAGKPYSEEQVLSRGDFMYVIEVKAGLAMKFGLTPGSTVKIPNEIAPQE